MTGQESTSPAYRTYDFDLHGIVGVRLLDAEERDLARVQNQLGPLQGDLDRAPDITIRFVDRVTSAPLTYVGLGDTGFNEDGFFVLRGKGGVAAKALFPFDAAGGSLEIVCERAMPAVPHLLAAINLAALGKGVLPLHASAFVLDSLGVLVTGWSKGGKTESLLAGMSRGGSYVGDEWVYLTPDGTMLGLPEPIRVWDWHLQQLPELLSARPRGDRARLTTWRALDALAAAGATPGVPGAGLVRRAHPMVKRQAYLQVPPVELFGRDHVRLSGRLDAVVLVLSHSSDDITTEAAGPTEISGRMSASLADERAPFLDHYRQFRFAFPDRRSTAVEAAAHVEASLLSALFDERPAAKVSHPHPCDIAALGDEVLAAARDLAGSTPAHADPGGDFDRATSGGGVVAS